MLSRTQMTDPRLTSVNPQVSAFLTVERLTKRFTSLDDVVTAVENVSLGIAQGEFLSVIGPSGCGKSTLFNIIGGLVDGYEGQVRVAGEVISGPHPAIGMVFQEESTFPWRTVLSAATRLSYPGACASASPLPALWRLNPRFS
jgi:ABC-type nitrate/sulfonate/bicarbonate transport system ATPase subunit